MEGRWKIQVAERIDVVVLRARAHRADLDDLGDLIGGLRRAWGIERVGARHYRERRSGVGRIDTVETPAAKNLIGDAGHGKLLPFAKRHFIHPAHDEHLTAVVAGGGAIAPEFARHVGEGQSLPAVVVGQADGLGEGVGALQEEPVGEVLVEGGLEGRSGSWRRPSRPT